MGSALLNKESESEKLKPLNEKLKSMTFPQFYQQSEILTRIFGKAKSLPLADLIYQICIIIYEIKYIMLYDYHQKRMVYSFYNNLVNLPEEVKAPIKNQLNQKIIPLDLEITILIAQKMLVVWWNKQQTIKDIFNSPVSLCLYIKKVNKEVKEQTLKTDSKLIVYGGDLLEANQKKDYSVVLGRRTPRNNPQIAFSPEETYISKQHCIINFAGSKFFIVDYSKKMFTGFQVENKPYLLKRGMVIQLSLIHRFFIDELIPEPNDASMDDDHKILKLRELNISAQNDALTTPYTKENTKNDKHFSLRFFDGDLKNTKFSFKNSNLIAIGRSKKNNIQILNKNISKFHCQIYFSERFGWLIQENTTIKNFEFPPSLGGTQILLKNYDEIKNKAQKSKEWIIEKDMVLGVGKTIFSIDVE